MATALVIALAVIGGLFAIFVIALVVILLALSCRDWSH